MAAAPRAAVKAPRLMAAAYRSILDRMIARRLRAAAASRQGQRLRILRGLLRYGLL